MALNIRKSRDVIEDDLVVLERREAVLRLRSRGQTLAQIAQALSVDVNAVHKDIVALRQDWQRRVARNRAVWMAEILSDIQHVRQVAFDEFYNSDQPEKEQSVEDSDKGRKTRRSKKTRRRDPRYLSIVQEADKQRAAVLGLRDTAAKEAGDDLLLGKPPKLLVIRDREQASQLVDITEMLNIEMAEPAAEESQGGELGCDY